MLWCLPGKNIDLNAVNSYVLPLPFLQQFVRILLMNNNRPSKNLIADPHLIKIPKILIVKSSYRFVLMFEIA